MTLASTGLAKLLEDRAVQQVVQRMRDELNVGVANAQADVKTAQDALAEAGRVLDAAIARRTAATEALEVFNNTFKTFDTPVVEREVRYFHLPSRTDKRKLGHFVKVEADKFNFDRPVGNIKYTCTCEAGAHNRVCWAIIDVRQWTKGYKANHNVVLIYKPLFDSRTKPYRGAE